MLRFVDNNFKEHMDSTIGAAFMNRSIEHKNTVINF